MIDRSFWQDKKVFITGHTGFKGSWLCLLLHYLGAEVTGYALQPPTDPSLYELCGIDGLVASQIADIRDRTALTKALAGSEAEIVIHMAAQSLVGYSYNNPAETYETNVLGTVNLLESVKAVTGIRAVVIVTSDKCYQNNEWCWGYRENEPLGGHDPYSSSKACAELVTAAYRNSFFAAEKASNIATTTFIATARAGNVIGGGDWSPDRLAPDCIRAILSHEPVRLRNPGAIRPWQHVLEPLNGYLMLAEALDRQGKHYAGAWNFGPDDRDARPVSWIAGRLCSGLGTTGWERVEREDPFHEAAYLKLDSSKARTKLGWHPRWDLEEALDKVIAWTNAYRKGLDTREVCLLQIGEYYAPISRDEAVKLE